MNLIQNTINLLNPDMVDRIEIEEDKMTIFMKHGINLEEFQDAIVKEAKREPKRRRGYHQKTRDEILKQSRGRARDPRVIAILEKHPNMTFKEWIEWQYPDINPQRVYDLLNKYKDISVRECIAKIGARKK